MEDQDHEEMVSAIARLAVQINQLARIQQTIIRKLQHAGSAASRQVSVVHFPSPSIIESTIIESPFVFPEPQQIEFSGALIRANCGLPSRILLVEDDVLYQQLLHRLLQRLLPTSALTVAANGAEALRHLQSASKYDLVLMDIHMPVMDGCAATQAIRRFDGVTPIVSMTGSCGPEDQRRYKDVGMNECLEKSLSSDSLSRLLSKYCRL